MIEDETNAAITETAITSAAARVRRITGPDAPKAIHIPQAAIIARKNVRRGSRAETHGETTATGIGTGVHRETEIGVEEAMMIATVDVTSTGEEAEAGKDMVDAAKTVPNATSLHSNAVREDAVRARPTRRENLLRISRTSCLFWTASGV